MKTVQIIFNNPAYNYVTQVNGTPANIKAYFIGTSFNFGTDEKENFQPCINVNILN